MFVFRKARNPTKVLNDLDAYLNSQSTEPIKWLAREVQSWNEFSYEELEAAIRDGRLEDLIDWQARYAAAINTALAPQWAQAIEAASKKASRGKTILSNTEDWVKAWLTAHGAELAKQLSDESKKAIANVLLKWQGELLRPREMAYQIRPLIGLNERQAIANANYRAKVYQRLIDDGVNPTKAAQRADNAATRYASKQHRYRAETIMLTETARAYNQGRHESVMRSIRAGYMNHCEMVWTTAGTNRVCSRCLELKDTVVGRTDESGVTLPPLHPRCRCAIMYRELKEQPKPKPNKTPENQLLNPSGNERDEAVSAPKYPKGFIPAKTIKEANTFAVNVLKISQAEYKGCALEVANEWNYGLFETFKRFPEIRKKFGFVGEAYERNALCENALTDYFYTILEVNFPKFDREYLKQQAQKHASRVIIDEMKIERNTCTQSMTSKHPVKRLFVGVTINRETGRNYRQFLEMLKQGVKIKRHPVGCDTVKSVLDHEVGHQLDDLLGLRYMPEVQRIFDELVVIKNGVEDFSRITEGLSRYAWDNDNKNRYAEFIAEAWAEYCNNPSPREIAQKLGAIVEREYAKKYPRGD